MRHFFTFTRNDFSFSFQNFQESLHVVILAVLQLVHLVQCYIFFLALGVIVYDSQCQVHHAVRSTCLVRYHLHCFTCSFFINIYNIEIVFVFSSPLPNLYPIKNVSKLGCQVSIQIPFYFISLGEPSLKQRFTLKPGWTYC